MGIGDELIRLSKERIIQMERELDWLRSRGGYADRIAEVEQDIRRERESLFEKIRPWADPDHESYHVSRKLGSHRCLGCGCSCTYSAWGRGAIRVTRRG